MPAHASTAAEDTLARALRRRGVRFGREHAIGGGYSVDFWFPGCRLAVEVDGPQHRDVRWKIRSDAAKCERLRMMLITTLRFTNAAVIADPDGVAARIAASCVDNAANRRARACATVKPHAYRRR